MFRVIHVNHIQSVNPNYKQGSVSIAYSNLTLSLVMKLYAIKQKGFTR